MNFSNATIKSISVHLAGNKTHQQPLVLSDAPISPDEYLFQKLTDYFLSRFPLIQERYSFSHPSSLEYNEVYNFVSQIFDTEEHFHQNSIDLARHLYENSLHPQIKSGEFYVCLFRDCLLDEKPIDVIGIFKSETKTGFLDIEEVSAEVPITYREGVDMNKLDKGCIIFNKDKQGGYDVLIVDNQNKGEEAQYWRENFLGLEQVSNEYYQTNQFLSITKGFISEQLDEEFDVERTEKIDLLNRSVAYFKTHDEFDKQEFEEDVFQDEDLIDSFRTFNTTYKEAHEIDEPLNHFEISKNAVKKQARIFKSVLKLDKNFHIYIHGDRNLIEKGYDEQKRKRYYKIYYDEEN